MISMILSFLKWELEFPSGFLKVRIVVPEFPSDFIKVNIALFVTKKFIFILRFSIPNKF